MLEDLAEALQDLELEAAEAEQLDDDVDYLLQDCAD